MTQSKFSRRLLLGGLGSLMTLGSAKYSFAVTLNDTRLVVILLRGALDGLHLIAPYGDPAYAVARKHIAIGPGNGAVKLDGLFAVHAGLPFFASEYAAGRALAVHGVATPYRDRSHFDAQNLLETGGVLPYAQASGWLNRAIGTLPALRPSDAIAVAAATPTLLLGAAKAGTYSVDAMPDVPVDILARVARMYAPDPLLSAALCESQVIAALAQSAEMMGSMTGGMLAGRGRQSLASAATTAAQLMATPGGPRITVLERGGWDSHANQPGLLNAGLANLDAALAALKSGLGALWAKTAVLCITEFGRTVAVNGTNGTDHGTASALLLVGGAVKGGRVIADWPGLRQSDLYEGRDLKPTIDMRAIIAGVLRDHLGVSETALATKVFDASVKTRAGLFV